MDSQGILNYLSLLNMDGHYSAIKVNCEICHSDKKLPLLQSVEGPVGAMVDLSVVGCQDCGHIYQECCFSPDFYQHYYDKFYRLNLFGDSEPDKAFFIDQIKRGDALFKSLASWLPETGRLLDVGCSAGGLMIPFAKRGWQVAGNDPDGVYADYGRRIGLDILTIGAEAMPTDNQAELIIINGSLEHVYDVNAVMNRCRQIAASNGLLLIEGRALGYGLQQGHLTHNHRRFLSAHSIEQLMLRHDWQPVMTTSTPLCGPTRPGAIFVLGRAGVKDKKALSAAQKNGQQWLQVELLPQFVNMRGRHERVCRVQHA
jgi:SAM-dependent methyltransferase